MFKKILAILFGLFLLSNTTIAFQGPNFSSVFTSKMQKSWAYYMQDLEMKIKKNWKPPQSPKSAKIVVYFLVGRNGELLDLKLKEKSYSEKLNDSAREAVIFSAPFAPLPKEYKGNSVPIEFSFDYNVVNKKQP